VYDARSERALVARAASGDSGAREQLIDEFWPRMSAVARIYDGLPSVDRAELMQEGVVGLLTALHRYEPERGVPFWSYASWWVRQAMQHLVCELTGPVVLSDRATRSMANVKRARQQHLRETGRDPSTSQLSQRTGLRGEQIDQLTSVERSSRSLEEPLALGDMNGDRLGDCIADPHAEDPYERVVDRMGIDDVAGLSDRLRERERHVVQGRYGFDGPAQTLQQLADEMHVSAERVRQIEEHALDQLRDLAVARSRPSGVLTMTTPSRGPGSKAVK
jgi:RNA polymerase sigma factor (sigma-70 family)